MKRLLWNVLFAINIWHRARVPLRVGYGFAASSDDSFSDGITASEAVDSEIDHWEE